MHSEMNVVLPAVKLRREGLGGRGQHWLYRNRASKPNTKPKRQQPSPQPAGIKKCEDERDQRTKAKSLMNPFSNHGCAAESQPHAPASRPSQRNEVYCHLDKVYCHLVMGLSPIRRL